jgi:predicted phosphodiesterase
MAFKSDDFECSEILGNRVRRLNTTIIINEDIPSASSKWERWYLLRSDAHHDNAHCVKELEKEHLDEAKSKNAIICDFGDLFCVMQGKYDPRKDARQLSEDQHGREDYLNSILESAYKFYKPYKDNFLMLSPGNHETNITKRCGVDLTKLLAKELDAYSQTYSGWIKFAFNRGKFTVSKNLWYHHGYGGGGIMSFGTLNTRRQASYLPDADIMVSGHTHDSYYLEMGREKLNQHGRITRSTLTSIRCPGYKDETSCKEGWATERGHAPKPLGAWWLKFRYSEKKGIKMSVIKAGE